MKRNSIVRVLSLLLLLSLVLPLGISTPVHAAPGIAGDTLKITRSDWQTYNLRSSASGGVVMTSAKNGDTFTILAVVTGDKPAGFTNEWYALDVNGNTYYIIVDPPNQTIIPKTTPTPVPTATPTPRPTASPTPRPTATPTPMPTPVPSAAGKKGNVVVINHPFSNYNVRSLPDATKDNILGAAYNGEGYAIIDVVNGKLTYADDSVWYKIWYKGQTGYLIAETANQYIHTSTASLVDALHQASAAYDTAEARFLAASAKIESYGRVPVLPQDYLEKKTLLDNLNSGKTTINPPANKYYNFFNINAFPNVGVIDGARINGVKFAMGMHTLDTNPTINQQLMEKFLLPWTTEQKALPVVPSTSFITTSKDSRILFSIRSSTSRTAYIGDSTCRL